MTMVSRRCSTILKPKKVAWKVYLPEDSWVHAGSGQEVKGGRFTVSAPIGQPPDFYRAEYPFAGSFSEQKNLA